MGIQIQITGAYGINDGSIHILEDGKELVMWDSAEWIEDPSLVYVIANAITNKMTEVAEDCRYGSCEHCGRDEWEGRVVDDTGDVWYYCHRHENEVRKLVLQ